MKAMNKVWVIGDASVDLVPEKQNSYLKCPGGASANVGVCVPGWAESAVLLAVLATMTPVASCARFFRITAWMSRFYAWIRP
ncbi:aminoimidazole riboside kinase [Salmonella enterica subsp. enterica serovar Gallinarum]|nr:aminoimidazole riboside kinase [Salmonella enterica subsp. enterica serovar Gallinarum]